MEIFSNEFNLDQGIEDFINIPPALNQNQLQYNDIKKN
jgi:hypothetical protein